MDKIYSIEALQSMYKSQFTRDIDKPTLEEFIESEPTIKTTEPIIKKVESVEELMMKLYREKERKVSEDYQNRLYKSPPPISDEDKDKNKIKWRNGRRYF